LSVRQKKGKPVTGGKSNQKKGKRRAILVPIILLFCAAVLLYLVFFIFSDRNNSDEADLVDEATEIETEQAKPDATVNEEPEEAESVTGEVEDESANTDSIEKPETVLKVISDGNYLLALVCKETTLKSDYAPADLQRIPEYMFPARELWLREEALRQLEMLWQAADADEVNLTIISAYRSYDYQKSLFQNYAANYGDEEANRFSARAGQSEHQLGTTVDFGGTAVDLKAAYAETDQGRWLADHAYQYGFAMSYPQGKEEITGYIYEPWHYRYIGLEAAAQWFESGLSLKEFLQEHNQYYD
jgi:zinc D-Ala-D-Ala carboxypeptidase